MILGLVCCLFVFLGIFISCKKDFKKLSINALFGMFFLNCLAVVIPFVYSVLYKNYHSTSLFFVLLSGVLGFLIIKLVNCKYEDCDNISILGFSFVNMSLLISHRFSILLLFVNILYYVLIGIYIKKSKSWIYVLLGSVLALIFSMFNSWVLGYVYGINIGFIMYFILSVYEIVFKNKEKYSGLSLVIGFVIALLGGLL